MTEHAPQHPDTTRGTSDREETTTSPQMVDALRQTDRGSMRTLLDSPDSHVSTGMKRLFATLDMAQTIKPKDRARQQKLRNRQEVAMGSYVATLPDGTRLPREEVLPYIKYFAGRIRAEFSSLQSHFDLEQFNAATFNGWNAIVLEAMGKGKSRHLETLLKTFFRLLDMAGIPLQGILPSQKAYDRMAPKSNALSFVVNMFFTPLRIVTRTGNEAARHKLAHDFRDGINRLAEAIGMAERASAGSGAVAGGQANARDRMRGTLAA